MRKVLVIAAREYIAAVRTKAFVIGLLIMPLMIGGSALMQMWFRRHVDTQAKHFAVVDRTPGRKLVRRLEAAARDRNARQIFDPETGGQIKPVFVIEPTEPSAADPEAVNRQRYELSERVRREEIFGFLDIGPDVLRPALEDVARLPGASEHVFGAAAPAVGMDRLVVRYQSNSPTYDLFQRWADAVLTEAIQEERVATVAGPLPRRELQALLLPVPLLVKGLSKRDAVTGRIEDAPDENPLISAAVPVGLMVLMFMLVLLGAMPLLQGVVEEKMQRIAEVLLGSVRPFELMAGKLLGMVAVALTLSVVYLGGGLGAAYHYEFAAYIPMGLLPWFVAYQALAVLMFGSLFIAVGAACSDMRETQSLMWPIMLLLMLPMFVLLPVIREPNGAFATGLSFFPFATPVLMLGRLAVPPGVPWWQPVAGMVLVLATTLVCVWAAGRIFRVGILMQGKGAQLGEMIRWVFRG